MLPKVHLKSHSKMSGSRWVTTSSWLSQSLKLFLCIFYVHSCYLFLISSAFPRSLPFLSFIMSIFAWNISLTSSIFLKRPLVFPILFLFIFFTFLYCSFKKDFFFSLSLLCYSLEHCIQFGISFPFSHVFHFFSQLFVKHPQTTTSPSCTSFSLRWFWSPSIQC